MAKSKWRTTVQVFPGHYREVDEYQLLEGLADLANLTDVDGYKKLQLKHPYIWPMRILSPSEEQLRWAPEAFDLVRLYRDMLRIVWTWPYDPDDSTERSAKRNALQLLMGTVNFHSLLDDKNVHADLHYIKYQQAWRQIRYHVRDAFPGDTTTIYPSWPSGQFVYEWKNEFQQGLYTLFRESWRARICRACKAHFVADKHQRQYCTSQCAGVAKKRNDLKWWRRTHGKE